MRSPMKLKPRQAEDALELWQVWRRDTQQIAIVLNRDPRAKITEAQVYNSISRLRAVSTTPRLTARTAGAASSVGYSRRAPAPFIWSVQ